LEGAKADLRNLKKGYQVIIQREKKSSPKTHYRQSNSGSELLLISSSNATISRTISAEFLFMLQSSSNTFQIPTETEQAQERRHHGAHGCIFCACLRFL